MDKTIRLFVLAVAGLLLGGLSGCYPGSLSVEETDVVATNYDPVYFTANNPQNYFMPDTVGLIGDPEADPQLTREEMDFILEQVARNMDEYGFERLDAIDEDDPPDLVLLVSAVVQKVGVGGCIPWWPGWGWGPWPPGWGWRPGYCYPSYVYSYDVGTLAMDMVPPLEVVPAQEPELRRVWQGGLNGVLRSSVQGNEKFIRDGIDKAFELSPYLDRTD